MKNIPRVIRLVWLAGLPLAWLLCANVAAADATSGNSWMEMSSADDGISSLPADDLNGWFIGVNPDPSVPSTLDPSQPWTSAANIATLNSWLGVVMDIGGDPSLVAGLYGLGMISLPNPVIMQVSAQDIPSNVSEPATSGILGGALALLGLYATRRAGRMRAD